MLRRQCTGSAHQPPAGDQTPAEASRAVKPWTIHAKSSRKQDQSSKIDLLTPRQPAALAFRVRSVLAAASHSCVGPCLSSRATCLQQTGAGYRGKAEVSQEPSWGKGRGVGGGGSISTASRWREAREHMYDTSRYHLPSHLARTGQAAPCSRMYSAVVIRQSPSATCPIARR